MKGKIHKSVDIIDDEQRIVRSYAQGDHARITEQNGEVIEGTVYDLMASGITIEKNKILYFIYFQEIAKAE